MNVSNQGSVKTKRRGCLPILGYVIGGGLLILLIIVIILLQVESRNAAQAREEVPPPGQFIDVGGRKLHLYCQGEGSPTIVLESGLGGWSIGWREIQAQLAQSVRVCAYDRAGYGWSDPDSEPRTAARMGEDLHTLLINAEEKGPFVLVAASWGAYPVQIFADRYPDAVAGLVLIDPAHEADSEILPEEVRKQQAALPSIYRTFATAARLGVIRAIGPQEMAGYAPFIATDLSEDTADLYYGSVAGAQWWEASLAELLAWEQNAAQLRESTLPNTLPLVVIGAGKPPEGLGTKLHLDRQALLQELADSSANGQFLVAEGSSHNIVGEKPSLLNRIILDLIEK